MADGEVGEAPGPVLVRHPPLTHPGHQLALLLPRQRAVRPDVFIAPPSLETLLVSHPFCSCSKLTLHSKVFPQGFLILRRRGNLDDFSSDPKTPVTV